MPSKEFSSACEGEVDVEGKEGLKEEGGVPGRVKDGKVVLAVLLAVLLGEGDDSTNIGDLREGGKEGGMSSPSPELQQC